MNAPLVSIIIPIYNVEQYLSQCIESVIQQTYSNIEIILVDDGSPDSSSLICNDYAHLYENIIVIHRENGGLSAARNTGLELVKGDYVFFLDADDYLAPSCIKNLVEVSGEDRSLSVIGYMLDFSNDKNIFCPQQPYGEYSSVKDFLSEFPDYYSTKFNFAWGKLYDTAIIKQYNLRFEEGLSLVEDTIFNIRYYSHYKKRIKVIKENDYFYRQHSGSQLSKKFDMRLLDWNIYGFNSIKNFLIEQDCFTQKNELALYRNLQGNFNYDFSLVASDPKIAKSDKKRIIREYAKNPIYRKALSFGFRQKRFDYTLLQWILKHYLVSLYLLMMKSKNTLKKR